MTIITEAVKEHAQWLIEDLELNGKIITSPGKFEGEMYYMPYFYEAYLEGDGDQDDLENDGTVVFALTDAEKNAFPELRTHETLMMAITDLGFVCEVYYPSLRTKRNVRV